jgi:transcription initiation factor IIE alpha subunit
MYQKETCPMCREPLDFREYTVSTELQEKIIKQLQELLEFLENKRAFSQLPFN